ncbi:hypothetical protein AA313_de0204151 [Arthrobotrys entomopaga]|nr:hypothetical protein AA313_de0204151 [Arthrobotrys entomopaga]
MPCTPECCRLSWEHPCRLSSSHWSLDGHMGDRKAWVSKDGCFKDGHDKMALCPPSSSHLPLFLPHRFIGLQCCSSLSLVDSFFPFAQLWASILYQIIRSLFSNKLNTKKDLPFLLCNLIRFDFREFVNFTFDNSLVLLVVFLFSTFLPRCISKTSPWPWP